MVVVLLQKNNEVQEQPITFFRQVLRYTELKYNIFIKQASTLLKDMKDIQIYVLQSNIVAYVPINVVKGNLV